MGAALHGIRTQRQFRRQSERYRRMIALLDCRQEAMERAETLEEIQKVATDTERIMREENSD